MKRSLSFLLIISLLFSFWAESDRVAAASGQNQKNKDKNVIRTTMKGTSGADRSFKMDSVKKVGEKFTFINWVTEYSQVSDGHFYYMRYVTKDKKKVGIFQDQGKKIGTFEYDAELDECEFLRYNSRFYTQKTDDLTDKTEIGVVDFKEGKIKNLCTISIKNIWDMDVVLYDNEIYCMYETYSEKCAVKKYDMTGKELDTYVFPDMGKNGVLDFINIWDGKIYYSTVEWKGKKQKVTLWSQDMKNKRDEKVFSYQDVKESITFVDFMLVKDDFYGIQVCSSKEYKPGMRVYSLPSQGGKTEQIGNGRLCDFTCNQKYYFYIDAKHNLHRKNRKTKKDEIISKIKVTDVMCTKKGLYVKTFDKWFDTTGYEWANDDYECGRYFISFDGKKEKEIAKRKKGYMTTH